ncbi:MAG: hypothetical protein ACP5N2_05680 [Candidatus Nanoarchaeia archaeon]
MVGLTKKGILIVLLTMIIFAPVFVRAQTLEPLAAQNGYHTTIYTEVISGVYAGSSYDYISLRESKLLVGTDLSGRFLVIERVDDGNYRISPAKGGRHLTLTTNAENLGAGSILIYPAAGDTPQGNVILGHTGTMARGNVGIGTYSPSYTLDVAGDTRISGQLLLTSEACGAGQCLTAGTNGALSCTPCSGGTGGGTTYAATSPVAINTSTTPNKIYIADSSITGSKIAIYTITSYNLGFNSVTYDKIAPSSIYSTHINNGSVTASKLSNSSVTTSKINSSAVTNSKIEDYAISTDKLDEDSVTLSKIDVEESAGRCPASGATLVYNASSGRLRWNQTVACSNINLQLSFPNYVCYPPNDGPLAVATWDSGNNVVSLRWNVTKIGGTPYTQGWISNDFSSPSSWEISMDPAPFPPPDHEYTYKVSVTAGVNTVNGMVYTTKTRFFCTSLTNPY